jgi:hypothetical protein
VTRDSILAQQLVGSDANVVTPQEERNGYLFWGLVTLFIGVPEVLAALSRRLQDAIPWPTISGLVGGDIEAHHHWTALVVLGSIVLVAFHVLTYPPERKRLGRSVPGPVSVTSATVGLGYVVVTAVAVSVSGLAAATAGAGKDALGYAIYVPLALLGVALPSAFPWLRRRVLSIPTLFAALALLRTHGGFHWLAAVLLALLVVLCFHLALYPWPNYPFGTSS